MKDSSDTQSIEVRECVECGGKFECHPQSGLAFCKICNYLAIEND